MASLGVAVMAHPKREQLVSRLVERLGIGDDQVIWDNDNNRWHTGRRAMQAAHEYNHEWSAVIQDDVAVCNDLLAGLEVALDHVPDTCIVQPFFGARSSKQRMSAYSGDMARKADKQGAAWIEMRPLIWGTVIVVPTWTIPDMLVWCDRRNWPNYDLRVGQYFYTKLHYPTFYTWPSLVDHLDSERDDVPSIVEHGPGRVARNFIGEDASALDVDWAGPVVRAAGLGAMYAKQVTVRKARVQHEQDVRTAAEYLAGRNRP